MNTGRAGALGAPGGAAAGRATPSRRAGQSHMGSSCGETALLLVGHGGPSSASGVPTIRGAQKETCPLEVGRERCGGQGFWGRRALAAGQRTPSETFLSGGTQSPSVAAASRLQFATQEATHPCFLPVLFPL